jgi:hypothetical protein
MKLGLFRRIAFDADPEMYQHQVDELALESQSFLQWMGLNITVDGFVFEGDDDTAPMTPPRYGVDGFAMEAIASFKEENSIECKYNLAIGGGHDKRCGQAISAPSRHGAVYTNMPNYACNILQTIDHEFVHMLGRQHSGFYKKGKYTYYTDGECLMGSNKIVMPNAAHMCEMGLVNYNTVTTSQTVHLMPLELNERDMLPGHYRAVRIGDYYLSIGKGIGTAHPIKTPSKLYVHEINVKMYGTEPYNDLEARKLKKYTYKHRPEMRVGDSYTLPTGVLIEYLDYADEVATVKITIKGDES